MNNKIIQVIREVHEQFKGGSGSGNFGHSGRPGKRGGSAGSKGGGASADQVPDWLRDLPIADSKPAKKGALKLTADVEAGLSKPKSKTELKKAVRQLRGDGDLRDDIGEVLKKAGYKYESSGQSGNGGYDLYYRGQFNVTVINENDKTRSELSEQ